MLNHFITGHRSVCYESHMVVGLMRLKSRDFPMSFLQLHLQQSLWSFLLLFSFSSCHFLLLLFTAASAVGQSRTSLWAYSAQRNICSNTSEKLAKKTPEQWCCPNPRKESFDRCEGSSTQRQSALKPWQKQERLTFTGELKHRILVWQDGQF